MHYFTSAPSFAFTIKMLSEILGKREGRQIKPLRTEKWFIHSQRANAFQNLQCCNQTSQTTHLTCVIKGFRQTKDQGSKFFLKHTF